MMKIEELIKRLENTSYESEEEYRADGKRISSHFLMAFDSNYFAKSAEYEYKPYFIQGHLLEQLIFEEEYENILKNMYIVSDWSPNESQQKLISLYVGSHFPHNLKSREEQSNHMLELIADGGLWRGVKDVTKIKNRYDIEEFWEYVDNLFAESPKYILSLEQYTEIQSAAERIRNLDIIKRLRNKDESLFYMIHPMYAVNMDIKAAAITDEAFVFPGKAQFDLLIVDRTTKQVTIVDFKTTSNPAGKFPIDYMKYKYYFQSFWYQLVLEHIIGDDFPIKFEFIVISKTNPEESPIIYEDNYADYAVWRGKINILGLFQNLDELINKRNMTPEQIAASIDSPLALINNNHIKLSKVIKE